jgi:hypothetical protein
LRDKNLFIEPLRKLDKAATLSRYVLGRIRGRVSADFLYHKVFAAVCLHPGKGASYYRDLIGTHKVDSLLKDLTELGLLWLDPVDKEYFATHHYVINLSYHVTNELSSLLKDYNESLRGILERSTTKRAPRRPLQLIARLKNKRDVNFLTAKHVARASKVCGAICGDLDGYILFSKLYSKLKNKDVKIPVIFIEDNPSVRKRADFLREEAGIDIRPITENLYLKKAVDSLSTNPFLLPSIQTYPQGRFCRINFSEKCVLIPAYPDIQPLDDFEVMIAYNIPTLTSFVLNCLSSIFTYLKSLLGEFRKVVFL